MQYCEYWREKLKKKPLVKFPKKLSPAIAGITQEFSFAYMKEAFVSTLLTIARHRSDDSLGRADDDEDDDLDDYELWREMQKTVKILRNDMGTSSNRTVFGHSLEAPGSPSVGPTSPAPTRSSFPQSSAPNQVELALQGCGEAASNIVLEHHTRKLESDHPLSVLPLITDSGKILQQPQGSSNLISH